MSKTMFKNFYDSETSSIETEAEETASRLRHFSFPNIYLRSDSNNSHTDLSGSRASGKHDDDNKAYTYSPKLHQSVILGHDSDNNDKNKEVGSMSPLAHTQYPPSPDATYTEYHYMGTENDSFFGPETSITAPGGHSEQPTVLSDETSPRELISPIPTLRRQPIFDFSFESLSDEHTTATTPQPYYPFVDSIRDDTDRQIKRNSVGQFGSLNEFAIRHGINIDDADFVKDPGSPMISIEAPFW